jgi:hypothetical protein
VTASIPLESTVIVGLVSAEAAEYGVGIRKNQQVDVIRSVFIVLEDDRAPPTREGGGRDVFVHGTKVIRYEGAVHLVSAVVIDGHPDLRRPAGHVPLPGHDEAAVVQRGDARVAVVGCRNIGGESGYGRAVSIEDADVDVVVGGGKIVLRDDDEAAIVEGGYVRRRSVGVGQRCRGDDDGAVVRVVYDEMHTGTVGGRDDEGTVLQLGDGGSDARDGLAHDRNSGGIVGLEE